MWGVLGLLVAGVPASAADLLSVWSSVEKNNPQLQQARAQYRRALAQPSWVRSGLLPQLGLTAGLEKIRQDMGGVQIHQHNDHYGAELSSVFSVKQMIALRASHHRVKEASAQLKAVEQALMLQTVKRYLAVLSAYARWQALVSQAQSVNQALGQAKIKLSVGVATQTDVLEAKAQSMKVAAKRLLARNQILDALDRLTEISGVPLDTLQTLGDALPLRTPGAPSFWQSQALRDNPSLQAARFEVLAERQDLLAVGDQRLPALAIRARWDSQENPLMGQMIASAAGHDAQPHRINAMQGSAMLTMPLWTSGRIGAEVRQAEAVLGACEAKLRVMERQVISALRRAYRGVSVQGQHVLATYQALLAQRSAYGATRAGFEAGTRTMLDVLTSASMLNQSRQRYAQSRLDFVESRLQLSFVAGALDPKQLHDVNRYFTKKLNVQKIRSQS